MDEAGFIAAYGPSAGISSSSTFADVVAYVISLINAAIPVLAALAVVLFFLGLVRFLLRSADAHGKAEDKRILMWGLLALFVLFSIWGILRVLHNTFLGPSSSGGPGGPWEEAQEPGLDDRVQYYEGTPYGNF